MFNKKSGHPNPTAEILSLRLYHYVTNEVLFRDYHVLKAFGVAVTALGASIQYDTTLKLECGPMPNVMVALPNIGGALCSTPQNLADAQ